MRSTRQLSITLPNEMAAQVRARVDSGEYASESEVVREGLRALQARERAFEEWLRGPVAAAYDAMKADPSRGRSSAEVRARLDGEPLGASARPGPRAPRRTPSKQARRPRGA